MSRSPALDPALYAQIVLLIQHDRRSQAVAAVEQEMGLNHTGAVALVDELWTSYQDQLPPLEFEQKPNHRFVGVVAAVAIAAIAVLGRLLLR